MTTRNDFYSEARKAAEHLEPLLNAEIEAARQRREKAASAASDAQRRSDLRKIVEKHRQAGSALVLNQYVASRVRSDLQTNGRHILMAFDDVIRRLDLDQEQAAKTASALLAAYFGEIESGIISWPDWDVFQDMAPNQVATWARVLAPQATQRAEKEHQDAAAEELAARAEYQRLSGINIREALLHESD